MTTRPAVPARATWWRQAPALRFLAIFLMSWVGLRAAFPFVPALWHDGERALQEALPPVLIVEEMAEDRQLASRDSGYAQKMRSGMGPRLDRDGAAGSQSIVLMSGRSDDDMLSGGMGAQSVDGMGAARRMGGESPVSALPFGIGAEPSEGAPPLDRPNAHRGPKGGARGVAGEMAASDAAAVPFGAPALAPALVPMLIPPPSRHAGVMGRDEEQKTEHFSASAWVFLRDNLARSQHHPNRPNSLPVAGELGGSQAGLRMAYSWDGRGMWQAYGRVSAALGHLEQREAALGISAAPIAALPVRVAAERRQKLGRDGRSAMAAMVVGGVSGQPLPMQFRLDAYGQAGIVGARRRDGFVDGALVVDRALDIAGEARSLRLGAVVAGAAQPDVSRVDIGPRISLPLPDVGKGMRISLDWRHRAAGNAQPKNGAALTLGADF